MQKTLRRLDSSGDTERTFDPSQPDSEATKEARALYDRVVGEKRTILNVPPNSAEPSKIVKSFDELGPDNLAIGALAGG